MNITWTYDRYGNRWNQSASGSSGCLIVQPSVTFNSNTNRIDQLSYDSAGDLQNDGVNSYTCDAEGRVATVNGTTEYVYDAEGRRVAKESSGAVTASYEFDQNGKEITIVNGSGQWQYSNLYLGGTSFATYDDAGTRFQLVDNLGSRRVQAETDGTAGLNCFNYPFGDGLSCTGPDEDATKLHFTGKEHDTESGNDYFGARYYGAGLGRFLTPDWAARPTAVPYAVFGDPQSLNLYTYVRNDPVTHADADGHAPSQGVATECTNDSPSGNGCIANHNAQQGQRASAQKQNTEVAQNKPSQLPHGGGVGVGGSADLGVVATGASATGSLAGGVFYQPGKGVSAGGTATGGAVLYAGKHTLGAPKQDQGRTANLGAYAGAGPFAFVTNATTVNQLSGHFATTTLNVGVGPVKFSLQLSTGNGIWEFSVGPPIPVVSPGIGFSVSHITTETCTTGGAC
jgi:RHS repeat-associated protein